SAAVSAARYASSLMISAAISTRSALTPISAARNSACARMAGGNRPRKQSISGQAGRADEVVQCTLFAETPAAPAFPLSTAAAPKSPNGADLTRQFVYKQSRIIPGQGYGIDYTDEIWIANSDERRLAHNFPRDGAWLCACLAA